MAARYRHTHWVGSRIVEGEVRIFDINALQYTGGWLPYKIWAEQLVPWLIKGCEPKSDGLWWPTHCVEVLPVMEPKCNKWIFPGEYCALPTGHEGKCTEECRNCGKVFAHTHRDLDGVWLCEPKGAIL